MAGIDNLFRVLITKNGSDLHISPGNAPLLRISGDLFPIGEKKITQGQCRTMLYEIMTDAYKEEFEANLDIDFAYEVPALETRFRANIFLGRHGISGVFRQIPSKILSIKQLGLPDVVLNFTKYSQGLVLVTGPTGCGKSTTLAAMIDYINDTQKGHIITVEDPIEFVHASKGCLVTQREVGRHTKSFKTALRASLREDPDIILVGEMRDLETIELAITAAETGHLVFGTLHTSSAAQTVDRIVNVFPTNQQEQIRTMIAESLIGIIAQQLPKTLDGKRCAATEILFVNSAVSNLIREEKTYQIPSIIQTGKNVGMQLLDQSLQNLVDIRRISIEEAHKYAVNKSLFPQKEEGIIYR